MQPYGDVGHRPGCARRGLLYSGSVRGRQQPEATPFAAARRIGRGSRCGRKRRELDLRAALVVLEGGKALRTGATFSDCPAERCGTPSRMEAGTPTAVGRIAGWEPEHSRGLGKLPETRDGEGALVTLVFVAMAISVTPVLSGSNKQARPTRAIFA